MAIGASEAETFWTELLRSLARRGLNGVKLVVSDDHKGLKAAATRILALPGKDAASSSCATCWCMPARQGHRVVSAFVATALAEGDAEVADRFRTTLLKQNDEWAAARRYMTLESITPVSDNLTVKLPAVAAAYRFYAPDTATDAKPLLHRQGHDQKVSV